MRYSRKRQASHHSPRSGVLPLLVLATVGAVGCSADSPTQPAEVLPVDAQVAWGGGGQITCLPLAFEILVDPNVLSIGVNGDARMKYPADATGDTKWTSSDTAVAKVAGTSDNWRGVTTAVDAGWSCIKVAVTNGAGERDGQARLAVPGVRVAPKSVTFHPGEAQQLTLAAAVAQDGTPMPASTIAWSSADGSVASVDSSGLVTARAGGTTSILASITGGSKGVGVTVLPTVSISGPARISAGASGTFSVSVTGCNTVCTYQWSILWTDNGTFVTHDQPLGTAATQTVRATMDAPQFEIDVAVTTNGVTSYAWKNVYVATTTGCTVKTGC